jgi:hypothetical protein
MLRLLLLGFQFLNPLTKAGVVEECYFASTRRGLAVRFRLSVPLQSYRDSSKVRATLQSLFVFYPAFLGGTTI